MGCCPGGFSSGPESRKGVVRGVLTGPCFHSAGCGVLGTGGVLPTEKPAKEGRKHFLGKEVARVETPD